MKKSIKTAVFSLCTILAFGLSFQRPVVENTYGLVYSILENLRLSIKFDFFTLTVLWAAFYYASMQIEKKASEKIIGVTIFNMVLAVLWLLAESLRIDNTFDYIAGDAGQTLKSVIYVIGMTNLLNLCVCLLRRYVFSNENTQPEVKVPLSRWSMFYEKHTYLSYFLLMLLIWLPNAIVALPARIECDVWDSIMMYFGQQEFNSHHPVVFTVLIGSLAQFFYEKGNINIAFAVWNVMQTISCAAIMAYVLYTMKKYKTPKWLIAMTLLCTVFSPYYSSYVCTIVKDTLYAFALLLYAVEMLYMHLDWVGYWKSKMHIALLWIATLVVMLFRHNGKYIIVFMLAYFMVRWIKQKKLVTAKMMAKGMLIVICPFLLASGLTLIVKNQYQVTEQENESMREALSIPFQQTARYAKYYFDETPEEEKTAIDTCIDYYCMPDVYEPLISDPVKARFHRWATKEQWQEYFKVWLKQFIRHPATYFGATYNQNYVMIYPMQENIRLYPNTYVDYFWSHEFMDSVGAQKEMTFEKANQAALSWYRLLQVFPITGIMSCLGVYNLLLLYMIFFAIHDRLKNCWGILFPIIISDLVVVAGPCIYDNIRYALPVVYMIPVALSYFIYIYRQRR